MLCRGKASRSEGAAAQQEAELEVLRVEVLRVEGGEGHVAIMTLPTQRNVPDAIDGRYVQHQGLGAGIQR